jgi:hypothetical protein
MFATNYYTLVAGFREYQLDADRKGFDAQEIRAEVMENLTAKDRQAVELLYGYYDCENLSAARAGRTAHNALGDLTREEILAELERPSLLPGPLQQVIRAYADPEGEDAEQVDTTQRFEKSLFAAYYALAARSSCRFLKVRPHACSDACQHRRAEGCGRIASRHLDPAACHVCFDLRPDPAVGAAAHRAQGLRPGAGRLRRFQVVPQRVSYAFHAGPDHLLCAL